MYVKAITCALIPHSVFTSGKIPLHFYRGEQPSAWDYSPFTTDHSGRSCLLVSLPNVRQRSFSEKIGPSITLFTFL